MDSSIISEDERIEKIYTSIVNSLKILSDTKNALKLVKKPDIGLDVAPVNLKIELEDLLTNIRWLFNEEETFIFNYAQRFYKYYGKPRLNEIAEVGFYGFYPGSIVKRDSKIPHILVLIFTEDRHSYESDNDSFADEETQSTIVNVKR